MNPRWCRMSPRRASTIAVVTLNTVQQARSRRKMLIGPPYPPNRNDPRATYSISAAQVLPMKTWILSPLTRRRIWNGPTTNARLAATAWLAISNVHGSSTKPTSRQRHSDFLIRAPGCDQYCHNDGSARWRGATGERRGAGPAGQHHGECADDQGPQAARIACDALHPADAETEVQAGAGVPPQGRQHRAGQSDDGDDDAKHAERDIAPANGETEQQDRDARDRDVECADEMHGDGGVLRDEPDKDLAEAGDHPQIERRGCHPAGRAQPSQQDRAGDGQHPQGDEREVHQPVARRAHVGRLAVRQGEHSAVGVPQIADVVVLQAVRGAPRRGDDELREEVLDDGENPEQAADDGPGPITGAGVRCRFDGRGLHHCPAPYLVRSPVPAGGRELVGWSGGREMDGADRGCRVSGYSSGVQLT